MVGMNLPPQRRWFHLTLDRLVLVLLVWDGFLLLAARFYWLAKGWPVMIALATVGVALLLMPLWFAAALLFRWRFQFSILSLLALTLAAAIPCAWLATEMRQATQQQQAIAAIKKLGGNAYDALPDMRPPAWLERLTGEAFFKDVDQVALAGAGVTDAGLDNLQGFSRLRVLWLNGAKVSDAGLEKLRGFGELEGLSLDGAAVTDAGLDNLRGLTRLQFLALGGSGVTDAGLEDLKGLKHLTLLQLPRLPRVTAEGVKKLQQALPKCKIQR